jgi:hypothetical protein
MSKWQKTSKGRCARRVLRIPDLEQSKHAVLNSLPAKTSQESYGHAIDEWTAKAEIAEGNVFRRVNRQERFGETGSRQKQYGTLSRLLLSALES